MGNVLQKNISSVNTSNSRFDTHNRLPNGSFQVILPPTYFKQLDLDFGMEKEGPVAGLVLSKMRYSWDFARTAPSQLASMKKLGLRSFEDWCSNDGDY